MMIADSSSSHLEKAREFQKTVLETFPKRSDAILQLIESLAGAEKPTSVVELSQEAPFQRTFSNVHKAIDAVATDWEQESGREQELEWAALFSEFLPEGESNYNLFAIDATSIPRTYAKTLDDRTYIHQNGPLGGQVGIGLQASLLAALPDEKKEEAKWTLPLSVSRISSDETPCQVAQRQLRDLSNVAAFKDKLCVIVADSGYTKLTPESQDQVLIVRCRTDRTGRRPYRSSDSDRHRGRPRKYQDGTIRFSNNVPPGDEGGPDEEHEREGTYRSKKVTILISRWKEVFVQGQKDLVDIVKVELFSKGDLAPLFDKPLLLMIIGDRRNSLSGLNIYHSYLRRFDIEHLFRFLKQKLLFCSYQTPCLTRQVSWW